MSLILAISFLFAFLNHHSIFAQTLLIPDSTISAENYHEKCQLDGYSCVQQFQFKKIVAEQTPLFDALIDSIDLSSSQFLNLAPKKIQSILQDEVISLDQLEMLVRLLEQTQTAQSRFLLNELNYLTKLLQKENRIENFNQDFVVFFKVPISQTSLTKMKKSILALPYFEVTFNRITEQKSTKGKSSDVPEYLVTGSCENATTSVEVKSTKWKVLSEKPCGWAKGLSQASGSFFKVAKENKSWIVAGALLLGAAMLANQYEVKFEF